jgi:hypothetical protein
LGKREGSVFPRVLASGVLGVALLGATAARAASEPRAASPAEPAAPAQAPAPGAKPDAAAPATSSAKPDAAAPPTSSAKPGAAHDPGAAPAPLPDPTRWHQSPEPFLTEAPPLAPRRLLDVGAEIGFASRPASKGPVDYSLAMALGFHARLDILNWLAARLLVRMESQDVSFRQGALGLPPGTTYKDGALSRVSLGIAVEPTYSPFERLDLYAGAGVSWARTTADEMHAEIPEALSLPSHSSVFVEIPFSLGARYTVIPHWLTLNAAASFGIVTGQTGRLFSTYATPAGNAGIVQVGGYPAFAETAWTFLAGAGVLL